MPNSLLSWFIMHLSAPICQGNSQKFGKNWGGQGGWVQNFCISPQMSHFPEKSLNLLRDFTGLGDNFTEPEVATFIYVFLYIELGFFYSSVGQSFFFSHQMGEGVFFSSKTSTPLLLDIKWCTPSPSPFSVIFLFFLLTLQQPNHYQNVFLLSVEPTFTRTPLDKTVKIGETAILTCEATGSPQPVIFWQKEDEEVIKQLNSCVWNMRIRKGTIWITMFWQFESLFWQTMGNLDHFLTNILLGSKDWGLIFIIWRKT